MPTRVPKPGKHVGTSPKLLTTRLAKWLEAEMAARDWTQLDVAAKARMTQGYVSRILRTGAMVDDQTVQRIAGAFGEDCEDLLTLVYLDRIERLLESAPRATRALFRGVLKVG